MPPQYIPTIPGQVPALLGSRWIAQTNQTKYCILGHNERNSLPQSALDNNKGQSGYLLFFLLFWGFIL